jgi:hypothetical protein
MMLKRKDGSYSKKGLYDNIRKKAAENKAAGKTGKEPTNEMLKQDAKIKENMKSKSNSKSPSKKMGGGYKAPQYQMGGDMIEPSKEVNFDRPMMRFGGERPPKSERLTKRAEKNMTKAEVSWTKAEQAAKDSEANPTPGTGNLERYADRMYRRAGNKGEKAKKLAEKAKDAKEIEDVKNRGVKKYGGIKKK